jgi:hypothetical protein
MGQADDRGGVQGCVDGAEAQDLGFGAAGGGAAQAGTELAQGRIAVPPEVAGRRITAEEDFGGSAADQVAEDGQKLEENGGRVGLGVRSDGADGESRETVKGGFAQLWSHRWA